LNIPSLTEQGALTVEEEIEKEEEEDKSWMDKLSENLSDLGSVAKTVLIAGGIAFVVITLKNYSQNKK
jgi:cytochrome b